MKKSNFLITGLFVFILLTNAKIKLKTIECPQNPIYGTLKLDLLSNLSIGSETDDRYFFTSIPDIRLDQKGKIYVLDSKNARIQVYSPDGGYIITLGGKGQGPGEFSIPNALFIDKKGNIYVHDVMTRKMTIFSSEGNYKKSISLDEIFHGKFVVDDEENIFANTVAFEPDGNMNIHFIKINSATNLKKKLVSGFYLKPIIDGGNRTFYEHPYLQNFYFSCLSNGNIAYVISLESKLFYLSRDGELVAEVLKREKGQEISAEEKEVVFQKYFKQMSKNLFSQVSFPRFRPIYSDLIVDDKDRIYLEKCNPINKQDSTYRYEVLNSEGKYLYTVLLGFKLILMNRGYIYTIQTNEESGEIRLLRYKIKNWDEIKEK
jgi:hypothetical protein